MKKVCTYLMLFLIIIVSNTINFDNRDEDTVIPDVDFITLRHIEYIA